MSEGGGTNVIAGENSQLRLLRSVSGISSRLDE